MCLRFHCRLLSIGGGLHYMECRVHHGALEVQLLGFFSYARGGTCDGHRADWGLQLNRHVAE